MFVMSRKGLEPDISCAEKEMQVQLSERNVGSVWRI